MISKDKQYRTRDGSEVRIYATDGCGMFCIHGAVKTSYGWDYETWDNNGKWNENKESDFDLIEIRPRIKREFWVNVYDTWISGDVDKEDAFENGDPKRRKSFVKIVIDCEEGEGL